MQEQIYRRHFLVSALTGHVEGSRAFTCYRTIDIDMKKDLVIQSKFGVHLFELAVLLLEFLEPADLAHLHATVLALPIVQCRSQVLERTSPSHFLCVLFVS